MDLALTFPNGIITGEGSDGVGAFVIRGRFNILKAFFHARHILAMVCEYAEELDAPPNLLSSGWANVLELYNLR